MDLRNTLRLSNRWLPNATHFVFPVADLELRPGNIDRHIGQIKLGLKARLFVFIEGWAYDNVSGSRKMLPVGKLSLSSGTNSI